MKSRSWVKGEKRIYEERNLETERTPYWHSIGAAMAYFP